MSYCTKEEVDAVLAQALTSATNPDSQERRSLLEIGNVRDKNVIPDDIVYQFISWASQQIDGILSQLYKTPLCEIADFESSLLTDIDEYNDYVVLSNPCSLNVGDTIILIQKGVEDRFHIENIVDSDTFTTQEPIPAIYEEGARVLRIKFPDPIPYICARLSAANIYEKYFAAEVGPQKSEYGNLLREQSRQELNNILNGRVILHGVTRIGRRLYDPNIPDQYGLPQGGEASRDIDQIS